MKSSLPFTHGLAIWLTMLCIGSIGRVFAQERPTKDVAEVAATVLGQKVYLRPIKASEVAQNRATLSAKGFERWQADSQWRPLVSRVSHLVMSDWAKQNKVRPTREEIQEHFSNEAKRHLQAYTTTPEESKRVTLAIHWGTLTAVEWATAKSLHEKYGGSIALSSFGGWIAIEGRNALVKEYAAAGKIRFYDPEVEKLFWQGIEDPAVLDVTVRDPKRVSQHFENPPWQGWGARISRRFQNSKDDHDAR